MEARRLPDTRRRNDAGRLRGSRRTLEARSSAPVEPLLFGKDRLEHPWRLPFSGEAGYVTEFLNRVVQEHVTFWPAALDWSR